MVDRPSQKVKLSDEPAVRSGPLIGSLFNELLHEIHDRVHQALNASGFADIRIAHHVVFQHLRPEGARVTELAVRARVTKQSMQYLVDHLESGGYLERVPDPADGRAKIVRLTARGRAVEQTARRAIGTLESEWSELLGEEAFRGFLRHLRQLNASLQR